MKVGIDSWKGKEIVHVGKYREAIGLWKDDQLLCLGDERIIDGIDDA